MLLWYSVASFEVEQYLDNALHKIQICNCYKYRRNDKQRNVVYFQTNGAVLQADFGKVAHSLLQGPTKAFRWRIYFGIVFKYVQYDTYTSRSIATNGGRNEDENWILCYQLYRTVSIDSTFLITV